MSPRSPVTTSVGTSICRRSLEKSVDVHSLIHAATIDENCSVALHLTAGQAHDGRQFESLYESLEEENVLESINSNTALGVLPEEFRDPDLLIRTGGEMRLSNFLLWNLAYTELYFSKILWPDFNSRDLEDAILEYCSRTRRFGGRECAAGV